jgi:hypothetical protein
LAAKEKGKCSVDSEAEVIAIVLGRLQLDFPAIQITEKTVLGDGGLGMDESFKKNYFYFKVVPLIRNGCSKISLGPTAFGSLKTAQEVIDAIWGNLKARCNLAD